MPIFDFTCRRCKQSSELLIMSSTVPACPHCGSIRLDRHVSAPRAPGKSAAIMAAGRAQATRAGHTSNYRRSNGKIVD